MIKKVIFIIAFFSMTLFAKEVATVTALKGTATIDRNGQNIVANLGLKVEDKDKVSTGIDTKMQIIFVDNTAITIGKNTTFSVQEYLFDESNAPEANFSLLKGAMRVMTGKIGKIAPEKFKVKVKNATIGIRGTNFSIVSRADSSFRVYCTFGAVTMSLDGKLFDIKEGFFVEVSVDGKVTINGFSSDNLRDMIKDNFGYKKMKDLPLNEANQPTQRKLYDKTEVDEVIKPLVYVSEIQRDLAPNDDIAQETETPIAGENTFTMDGVFVGFGEPEQMEDGYGWDTISMEMNDGEFDFFPVMSIDDDVVFMLDPTPISFVSKENFEGRFIGYGSNIEIDASADNYLKATADLEDGDYMSWGEWAVTYTNTSASITESLSGFWVAGEQTSADIISNYTMTDATYSGIYMGTTEGSSINGTAELYVNFDQGFADLTLEGLEVLPMDVVDNKMSLNYEYSGSSEGHFYGPTGNEAAGEFVIEDASSTTQGVYQVKSTQTLY